MDNSGAWLLLGLLSADSLIAIAAGYRDAWVYATTTRWSPARRKPVTRLTREVGNLLAAAFLALLSTAGLVALGLAWALVTS